MTNVKSFADTIRDNPLQTITTLIAVIGVVVSIINFFILSRIQPLILRIERTEATIGQHDLLVPRYLVTEEKVLRIEKDIGEIKDSQLRVESRMNSLFDR